MQETWVGSLGQEDPLEEEVATHSSILIWRIPWTEEPGRLQSMGSTHTHAGIHLPAQSGLTLKDYSPEVGKGALDALSRLGFLSLSYFPLCIPACGDPQITALQYKGDLESSLSI